ncbi:hypothetical protein ES708_04183 [subsurface metagenome]
MRRNLKKALTPTKLHGLCPTWYCANCDRDFDTGTQRREGFCCPCCGLDFFDVIEEALKEEEPQLELLPIGRAAAALPAASPVMRPGMYDVGGNAAHVYHHSRAPATLPGRGLRLFITMYDNVYTLAHGMCFAGVDSRSKKLLAQRGLPLLEQGARAVLL